MSSRGGTAEDPSAVHLPRESSLDRKSADTAMRLVIQPTSLPQSTRPLNPDQASVQNTLKTGLLVSQVCWLLFVSSVDCRILGSSMLALDCISSSQWNRRISSVCVCVFVCKLCQM